MSQQLSNNGTTSYETYTGFWINWDKSPTFGATITLNRRDGGLLIAFLAMFVTVVGTSFWRIACFIFHQIYSSIDPQDALYHQRQAVLRNSANGANGLSGLANIIFAWRKVLPQINPFRRILPLTGFAIVCVAGFGLASTFSSRISTAMGNDVLIRSPTCGIFYPSNVDSFSELQTIIDPYRAQTTNSYANYAQSCRPKTSMNTCNSFIKRRLPTNIDRNGSCPFQKDICRFEYGNIVLDTGLLDSHFDFGINAPPKERVQYRRVSSCAPIKTDGYQEPYSDPKTQSNYTRYFYGQNGQENFTYQYPDTGRIPKDATLSSYGGDKDYTISILRTHFNDESGSYKPGTIVPVPELQLNTDVRFVFLSANNIIYAKEVDDPLFSAHKGRLMYTSSDTIKEKNTTMYYSDRSASVLACSITDQYCNPNSGRCTPLRSAGWLNLTDGLFWANKKHGIIFNWIALIVSGSSTVLTDVPLSLGESSLNARTKVTTGQSGPLPDNQWQIEVENWHAASLVALQGQIADTAKGLSNMDIEPWWLSPSNNVERNLCTSQKIPNSDYFNISVFGLCFTLILGSIIIVLSWTKESIVGCIGKCRNLESQKYSLLEWNMNDTFQLQRLAHEELGVGSWQECASDVPRTHDVEKLAVLDIEDPNHPRLKAPPLESVEEQPDIYEISDSGSGRNSGRLLSHVH
ncbi:uncharacterized protein K452DRAFT_357536 [Aplosporella prunicola CBS 121167]|uniref:Uncharacterized protein n=1 Tax=Aplosporella prunicola CBS 121167 TaxID=1176127 RepID=A0A6A6BG73_9PEZI|nr:uncharacterized protein K452DRAFT_357536 [Aplosporella prunicola CBS 121167]KAF2143129.1 hypothetical protein K452DRAFT_357536 [Aplosporella prunicola CBS 121167]